MLHPIAQLGQDGVGDVGRVLGDEIDPHPLGADQAHHLLDLLQQALGRVVEQQVGLVEEEDQTRFVRVADLGQLLEQFRQQPQQEGGVQTRAVHQPGGVQHIDLAPPVQRGAHHVLQPQGRLAEEGVAALLLQLQQGALDGGDGGGRDIADLAADGLGVLADIGQQGAQVLEVQQQQALLVGDVEGDGEDPLLHVVQLQHPGQQGRTDVGYGGADRMPLLAVEVPEDDRRRLAGQGQAHAGGALGELGDIASLADAGQVALHVRAEDRNAGVGEALGHDLQGHGLAGAGGAGHDPMTVGALEQQVFSGPLEGLAEEEGGGGVGHAGVSCVWPHGYPTGRGPQGGTVRLYSD